MAPITSFLRSWITLLIWMKNSMNFQMLSGIVPFYFILVKYDTFQVQVYCNAHYSRPIAEVKSKLEAAINKGWFKVKVADEHGGSVSSQAEAGSLVEVDDR